MPDLKNEYVDIMQSIVNNVGKSTNKAELIALFRSLPYSKEKKGAVEAAISEVLGVMPERVSIKVEEEEQYGYKGKAVTVIFPSKGNFKGFSTKFFIPDRAFTQREYLNSPLLKKGKSKKEIVELLEKYREYMKASGYDNIDIGIDYSKLRAGDKPCDAGQRLIKREGMPEECVWLKDTYISKDHPYSKEYTGLRCWNCEDGFFNFGGYSGDNYAMKVILDM